MAEQEVSKHTKNVFKILYDKHPSFAHKLREIALEVVIIVFAVSMSIWLHGLGEHRHEQQQVKTFLLGLQRDLQGDLVQIDEVVAQYQAYDANFSYLASLDAAQPANPEKFEKALLADILNILKHPPTPPFILHPHNDKLYIFPR